jgi:outer membrane protein TolC
MHGFPLRLLILAAALCLLSACARYSRLPLDSNARYAASVAALQGAPASPAPLGEAEVTQLILQNNPSLKLAALRRAEARSQADAGALLPNPSFSGSLGYLLSGDGNATAWTAALTEPVNAWITLRARRDEAKAATAEVDASLAWEAWQTLARGRQLVTDVVLGDQLLDAQSQLASTLQHQWTTVAAAQGRGDLDATTTAPIAQAASEAAQAAAETERGVAAQRRELRSLMGLSFDAPLPLAPLAPVVPLDDHAATAALQTLPRHRPDLVALAMGYDAQDARFRAAVLSQFPALSVGYAASQDNSRVKNGGPAVTIDLPIFDRGRVQADAEGVTRQRLHEEYSQRVADAHDEVRALMAAQHVAERQLTEAAQAATLTADRTDGAAAALARGDLDRQAYSDLSVASLSRRVAALRTELAVREQRIGLDTLLGIGMPVIASDKDIR